MMAANAQPTSSNDSSLDNTLAAIIQEANVAYVQHQYEHAAMLFSQVAESFAKKYGTLHPKCGDIHWRYGRAILQLAIENSGLLGDTDQLHPITGKSEKELVDMVTDPNLSLPANTSSRHFHFSEDQESQIMDNSGVGSSSNEIKSETDDAAHHAETSDQEEGEEEEIDQDDFEIAFEVLDVARIIYSQMLKGDLPIDTTGIPNVPTNGSVVVPELVSADQVQTSDMDKVKQRYAQVLAALGDVSLESESFDQAITDYTLALEYLVQVFPAHDRRLAETNYKLALALEYSDQPNYELALTHLQTSLSVLVSNRDLLMQVVDVGRVQNEIKEINELVPELELKIEDIKQTVSDLTKVKEQADVSVAQNELIQLCSGSINDLSHAIKKKPVQTDSPIKKAVKREASAIPLEENASSVVAEHGKKQKLG